MSEGAGLFMMIAALILFFGGACGHPSLKQAVVYKITGFNGWEKEQCNRPGVDK